MEIITGQKFHQPDINSNVGFSGYGENGEILGKLNLTSSNDEYSVEAVNPGEEIGFYFGDKDSLNNFGVPQAKVIDALAPSFIGKSTHFSRFASDPASATIINDAVNSRLSLFISWFGINDVLNYAMHGAAGNENGLEKNDMTSVAHFRIGIEGVIQSLKSSKKHSRNSRQYP